MAPKRKRQSGKKKKRKHKGRGFDRKTSNAFPGLSGNISRRLGGGTKLIKTKKRGKKSNSKLANYKPKGHMGNNGGGVLKHYGRKRNPEYKHTSAQSARRVMAENGAVRTDMPIDEGAMKPALLRFMM